MAISSQTHRLGWIGARVLGASTATLIDPDPNVPVVLIAGGIGITPLMSMLRWCVTEQPASTVHLYYGLRHGDEHAFKRPPDELTRSQPNFRLHVAYSRPGTRDDFGRDYHHPGHVDAELLRRTPAIRERCQSCDAAPTDAIHRDLNVSCSQCHASDHWKPATFDHAHLAKVVLERCEACHRSPSDSLHRQIKGNCGECHTPEHWKPATFDHDKLFLLDRNHNTDCTTCHTSDDFSHYTCYGCHEHQPDRVRAEHVEEGIRDFSDCVKCHRSASEEPERNGSRDGRERD